MAWQTRAKREEETPTLGMDLGVRSPLVLRTVLERVKPLESGETCPSKPARRKGRNATVPPYRALPRAFVSSPAGRGVRVLSEAVGRSSVSERTGERRWSLCLSRWIHVESPLIGSLEA
jgi:hypothetical protein